MFTFIFSFVRTTVLISLKIHINLIYDVSAGWEAVTRHLLFSQSHYVLVNT